MLVAVSSTKAFLNELKGDADTITAAKDLTFDSTIVVDRPVTIEGSKGKRGTKLTHTQVKQDTPLFDIRAPNVTIENITLVGNGRTNTNQGLVNLNNDKGKETTGFTANDASFLNADKGVSNNGDIPRDTTVTQSTFTTARGIDFNRDGLRGNASQATEGGKLELSGNVFNGKPQFGISIDAGNDGNNPNPAPGFRNNGPARDRFNDLAVEFEDGQISRNTVNDSKEFGIAAAAASNLTIAGNKVTTAQNPSGFGAAINVEHNSENVVIDKNQVNNRAASGQRFGVSVLPFQDHGATANFSERTKNVTVSNNTFTGTARAGVFALGAENLEVVNNDFSGLETDFDISSGNVPGGKNTVTASGNTPSNRITTFANSANPDPTPNGANVTPGTFG